MRTTQRSSSTAALLLIWVTMSAAAQAAEPPTASVSSPPAIAAPAAPSQPAPVEANATQSPAPMAAPNSDKARIDLTGFVAAQITFDTNDAVRQNHLISVDGQGRVLPRTLLMAINRPAPMAITQRAWQHSRPVLPSDGHQPPAPTPARF